MNFALIYEIKLWTSSLIECEHYFQISLFILDFIHHKTGKNLCKCVGKKINHLNRVSLKIMKPQLKIKKCARITCAIAMYKQKLKITKKKFNKFSQKKSRQK